MPFDPNNPNIWIDHITDDLPPFIRSLCKSLYHENLLVRLPQRPILCSWGMASQGRVCVIPEDDAQWVLDNLPPPDRMLRAGDARYDALVRQEDPEATAPLAYAVAAFKYAGGNVPQAPPGADAWLLLHVYESLNHYAVGNKDEAAQAARHYTQSANLVAAHPVVRHLIPLYPCVLSTLQARSFTAFGPDNKYDPERQFAPGLGHDKAGFVVDNNQEG